MGLNALSGKWKRDIGLQNVRNLLLVSNKYMEDPMVRWPALGLVGLLFGGVVHAQEWDRTEPNAIIAASLERAAQTSVQLEASAVPSLPAKMQERIGRVRPSEGEESTTKMEGFPRQSHLLSYREARPWLWWYALYAYRGSIHGAPKSFMLNGFWQDAEGLMSCLNHTNSMVRAMAVEALATLHHPEDVPLLAAVIDDECEASPFLGYNTYGGPRTAPVVKSRDDVEQILPGRSWRKQTVGDYARRGLELMTGKHFANKAEFDLWWASNSGGKDCLWYWQQRLDREMEVAERVWELVRRLPGESSMDFNRRRWAMQKSSRAYVNFKIEEELRGRSPEVEAKIRLLAHGRHLGAAPITGSEKRYWPNQPNLRLSRERLLELLERKDLWRDVEWNAEYNMLSERMGIWADVLFEPADASRLMAVLEKERGNLCWSGRAGLIIGISRLLPPASADGLNDPETQDGFLRLHIDCESDRTIRDYCTRELIRVGLPQNSGWLKSLAFNSSEDDSDGINRTVNGMLQELTSRPLTAEKRGFLVDLLLDPRFESYWTRPNPGRGRAMDAFRDNAIKAINAYAGSELVARELNERLVHPRKSKSALDEIHSGIGRLKSLDAP